MPEPIRAQPGDTADIISQAAEPNAVLADLRTSLRSNAQSGRPVYTLWVDKKRQNLFYWIGVQLI